MNINVYDIATPRQKIKLIRLIETSEKLCEDSFKNRFLIDEVDQEIQRLIEEIFERFEHDINN